MKFPKYWAHSSLSEQEVRDLNADFTVWDEDFSVWQWSDESVEDARHKAKARINELIQKLANGVPLDRYSYGDHPLREETLESITNQDGREIAVISRNAYGAQVLNTAKAMFIDIDFPIQRRRTSLFQQLGQLFRKPPPLPSQEETALERVRTWAQTRPELGLRVYRTAAGLRCLITSHLFDPFQSDTLNILQTLNSDPLYIRLCKAQECFRARLTPKHWRCGVEAPPTARYPWEDRKQCPPRSPPDP